MCLNRGLGSQHAYTLIDRELNFWNHNFVRMVGERLRNNRGEFCNVSS
jgi:hypothetical protein